MPAGRLERLGLGRRIWLSSQQREPGLLSYQLSTVSSPARVDVTTRKRYTPTPASRIGPLARFSLPPLGISIQKAPCKKGLGPNRTQAHCNESTGLNALTDD